MIAHHNVIAQSMQVEQITPKENKKVLAVLPLFHSQLKFDILPPLLKTTDC